MNEKKKGNIGLIAVVVVIIVIVFTNWITGSDTPSKDMVQSTGTVAVVGKIIAYDVLREWQPNNNKTSLGIEVLIDKQDVSERNIKRLVRSLSEDYKVAVIKVYQSKDAWLAESSGGAYTNAQRKGYLAYFSKGRVDSNILWTQSIGVLEELDGTREQM